METLISPFTLRKAMIALLTELFGIVCLPPSVNKNTSHRQKIFHHGFLPSSKLVLIE
jgi:hypothetical protein